MQPRLELVAPPRHLHSTAARNIMTPAKTGTSHVGCGCSCRGACAHMNTQKVPGQVLLTMAGPSERAGLMEHPEGKQGKQVVW